MPREGSDYTVTTLKPVVGPKPARAQDQKSPLRVIRYADIDPAPRKVFLVEKMLGAGEASCAYGAPGSAKSALCTDLAAHVAAGREWFGRRVRQGAVLYIAAERSKLVERRLAAFRSHHGIDDMPLSIISGAIDLRSGPECVGHITNHAHDLTEQCGQPVELIIIDTVSRALNGGDENSPKDMGAFIANIAALQHATGAHVLTIHHIPQGGDMRLRGHGSLLGALDTTIAIQKSAESRSATIIKDNDGAEGQELHFDLTSVLLYVDHETSEETTAPVVTPLLGIAPKSTTKRSLSARQTRSLDALTALCANGNPPPLIFDLPTGVRVVDIKKWEDELFDIGVLDREHSNPRAAFKQIRDSLHTRHLIGERKGLVWSA